MQILDRIISGLDTSAPLRDIRVGTFHSAVLTRYCGLASSLTQDALKQHIEGEALVKEAGSLLSKSTRQLVEMAYSDSLLEAAIGMATINSLVAVDETRCLRLNAYALLAEKGRGKNIAVIGHFPFIPKLRDIASALWVIEHNPQPDDYPAEQSSTLLPRADVVGITGTAITNHTLEGLLALCRPEAYIILLGDSAPLSPVLFDYGISAVCGTRVDDESAALQGISQGATYRQIAGISKLVMLKNP